MHVLGAFYTVRLFYNALMMRDLVVIDIMLKTVYMCQVLRCN